ncbi:Lrp/AsnC family transcriptional regulator [uncultured Sneathiella sp.]|uniref:Lrp/AsnC family transcriptional regulator n=1 Tax=uncultured Sneathiella sp. TaxID=879315 RepID=UPI0030ED73C3|tara:strand:+ start:43907 stop:44407 length:501 start_codon:yes stop_codon:yes gene_type:complete
MRKSANLSKIDKIDCAILNELQEDSRLTIYELGSRVGLSSSPCSRRLRQLEDRGIIKRYTTIVDENLVGLPISVFVSVKLERQIDEALTAFEEAIQSCTEVVDCWLMTGNRDYLLRVVAPSLADYETILATTLTKIPGVASIESSLPLRRIKASTIKINHETFTMS